MPRLKKKSANFAGNIQHIINNNMSIYYPINLYLKNKKCLIVGGGSVAERKVLTLLEYEASIELISPKITPVLAKLVHDKSICYIDRRYKKGDVKGAMLVIVATNDALLNKQIASEAEDRNCLINVVDCPALCNFIVPSIVRRGDLQISIGTDGTCPALAKRIRKDLEVIFDERYEEFLKLAKKVRNEVKNRIQDINKRKDIMNHLVYSDLLQLIHENKQEEIEKRIQEIIS